jgi:ATP-dependent DNA helicase RecQ
VVTDRQLRDLLVRYWGYHEFRPLQRDAVSAILEGHDSVVVLPTGGGKSLCFQLPALVEGPAPGLGLVVSPLISLMKDQVDGLVASGVPAAALNSSLEASERERVMADLESGRCRLLYVSPERMVGEGGERFRSRLLRRGVRFVAVDEAHCISQWGHDFRPEYRQLAVLREAFPGVSLHAFTATATARVRDDISRQLALRDPRVLVGPFDRPNLVYRVVPRTVLKEQILQVLRRHQGEAGIIYCISRREVEAVAAWLATLGHRALPYHAGLDDATRRRHQEAFADERADVVVATVAFGMGIDRSDVRFVVHAGAPRSLEHYQQESGRAGRDGLEAECVLIYSGADFVKWRQILEQHGELSEGGRTLLRDMERYASGTRCRHRVLVEYFGQGYDSASCEACDWCLHELERVDDSLTLARKILSGVARLQQGFGVGHLIDVLRGRSTDAVTSRHHDALSTFGLLSDTSAAELRGYVDQLAEQGLIRRTEGPYPVLQLTVAGVAALKGDGRLVLYRQPKPAPGDARDRRARPAGSWEGVDRGLFDALRERRLEVARQRGVPPYVIFHDETLRALARSRPSTPAALLDIHGIGARKALELGPLVLETILEYCRVHGLDLDAHGTEPAGRPPRA